MTTPTNSVQDEKPIKVDSGPRPEDGDQSTVSQDPNERPRRRHRCHGSGWRDRRDGSGWCER